MKTAKIFRSGNSQAVRIPKALRMEGEEVEIHRKGKWLQLRPKQKPWKALIESLDKFTDDFMHGGRDQPDQQRRGRAFSGDSCWAPTSASISSRSDHSLS